MVNAIEVLSNNSSNNKDNNDPLFDVSDEAKNNFKDHIYNKEENDPNAMFFRQIYVHIFLIYPI